MTPSAPDEAQASGAASYLPDPGLQNERTALAWQRTALSMIAASAVMARLTWSTGGVAALVVLVVAASLSTWVFLESRGRYAHSARVRLRASARGGRAPMALTLAVALLALTEIGALLR